MCSLRGKAETASVSVMSLTAMYILKPGILLKGITTLCRAATNSSLYEELCMLYSCQTIWQPSVNGCQEVREEAEEAEGWGGLGGVEGREAGEKVGEGWRKAERPDLEGWKSMKGKGKKEKKAKGKWYQWKTNKHIWKQNNRQTIISKYNNNSNVM